MFKRIKVRENRITNIPPLLLTLQNKEKATNQEEDASDCKRHLSCIHLSPNTIEEIISGNHHRKSPHTTEEIMRPQYVSISVYVLNLGLCNDTPKT